MVERKRIHIYLTQCMRNQGDQLGSHIDINTNTYQTTLDHIMFFEDNTHNGEFWILKTR